MKKINLLLLSTLVAFGTLFTSCSSDDSAEAPLIETFTADATIIEPGDTVTFTIKVRPGSEKTENIKIFKDDDIATDINGNVWNGVDATGSKGYIDSNDIYSTTAKFKLSNEGVYSFTAKAFDDKGNTSEEVSVTITVSVGGTTPVLFSSVAASKPSIDIYCLLDDGSTKAFSTATGTTYTYSQVNGSGLQSSIDFIYFNNSQTYTLYSPSSISTLTASDFGGTLPTSVGNIKTWSTKNTTTFVDVTGQMTLANATEGAITTALNSSSSTKISDLSQGDVVAFETVAGEIGIFEVNSITKTGTATDYGSTAKINIDILVK